MKLNSEINLSLVAFYGDKPGELVKLINQLQEHLASHQLIQDNFVPYQLEQVHGTIIGCEGLLTESGIISNWFKKRRQETRSINFSGLTDYLQHQVNFPLNIRVGGYNRQKNYNFSSRGEHPYFRSGQLQAAGEQTIPIVIGWSWKDQGVSREIDNLRRNLQKFNLWHKYHDTPEAIDNDFYLRLGTINQKLTSEEKQTISIDLCNLLETQVSLSIPLHVSDLVFVQYQDTMLTPVTTKIIPIAEIEKWEALQKITVF